MGVVGRTHPRAGQAPVQVLAGLQVAQQALQQRAPAVRQYGRGQALPGRLVRQAQPVAGACGMRYFRVYCLKF